MAYSETEIQHGLKKNAVNNYSVPQLKYEFGMDWIDFLYRTKTKGKWSGWKSYRKAVNTKGKNPPYPWDMIGSPSISDVEWKIKSL
jgi:hypothetical protein